MRNAGTGKPTPRRASIAHDTFRGVDGFMAKVEIQSGIVTGVEMKMFNKIYIGGICRKPLSFDQNDNQTITLQIRN